MHRKSVILLLDVCWFQRKGSIDPAHVCMEEAEQITSMDKVVANDNC